MSSKNPPIEKIRFGRISVSIWENTDKDGNSYHTFSPERAYKDENGDIKSTKSFNLNDLLTLAEACRQAHNKAYGLRSGKASEADNEDAQD